MPARITTLEQYKQEYNRSIENPEGFWADIASNFNWRRKWDKVLEWNFTKPDIKWFLGGKLNITENCLDRHLEKRGEQTAILWEPNDPKGKAVKLTYRELHAQVCRFANVLKSQGVKKGSRVCIYMPMVPEVAVAVLACARIGAIHSVVFAGFSVQSLANRINDSQCEAVITSDGSYRGAKDIEIKKIVDDALLESASVRKVVVLRHTGIPISMKAGRDIWWHEEMQKASPVCPAEEMDAEDELFILYTSGSTGKPKGVVHTIGGYMVYAWYTFINVFQYNDGDVYWCTADIGWITGHSYIVYGPLLAGATTLMFEGIPTYPDAGRFWHVVDKHRVNIFYTSPTAIRSLEAAGLDYVKPYSLSSLRVLGTVGEPINEEAWEWYHINIGKERCPIVDTWWQTETGGILISPLAGITKLIPSYATLPLPGIQPVIVNFEGKPIEGKEVEGNLCIKFPWPGMLRTTWGDHERCRKTYFNTFKNLYETGDGAKRDENGYYRITGRVDDVMKVSGHRLGTADIEDAIDEHPDVVESAVVGFPHPIKGQGIYAYVVCRNNRDDKAKLRSEITDIITKLVGPIAKPDKIQFVGGLPKTRSGKIMRRILRKVAEGETDSLGDTSTLLDPSVVDEIKKDAI